jgi:hypothetical protein
MLRYFSAVTTGRPPTRIVDAQARRISGPLAHVDAGAERLERRQRDALRGGEGLDPLA